MRFRSIAFTYYGHRSEKIILSIGGLYPYRQLRFDADGAQRVKGKNRCRASTLFGIRSLNWERRKSSLWLTQGGTDTIHRCRNDGAVSMSDKTPERETTNATRKDKIKESGKKKKKRKEKRIRKKRKEKKSCASICNQSCCCSRYCPLLDVTYVLYTCAVCARVWSPLAWSAIYTCLFN